MIQVFLEKRLLKKRKRNGQREFRWVLRWEEPDGKRACESTGTADRTQAESQLKAKWAVLNAPTEKPGPEPEPVKASWQECRDAFERAMQADNLRPSYLKDATLMFDKLLEMFPDTATPADVTPEMANEFKRRRAEINNSPWSTRGDLGTLKAVFGKWLMRECSLLNNNPFANVKPPKCDDPDVRIVSAAESQALFAWLSQRWNDWKLPAVYLELAALVGWRATEIASIRDEDLLPDGFVRVVASTSKTRKHKYGWLPDELYQRLKACSTGGWVFGRFSDELSRLYLVWKREPHHAARVRGFTPKRLVGWLQDELARFNDDVAEASVKEGRPIPERFTLHDFRRTAITGLQMAGVTEKEASVMVGATPEVIRSHYEKLDQLAIAKRSIERRLSVENCVTGNEPVAQSTPRLFRAEQKQALDGRSELPETAGA
jgi:integrase